MAFMISGGNNKKAKEETNTKSQAQIGNPIGNPAKNQSVSLTA